MSNAFAQFQARHPGMSRRLRNSVRAIGTRALFAPVVSAIFGTTNRHLRDIAYHAIRAKPAIRHFCVDTAHESMIINTRDDVISREVFRSGHFDFHKFEKAVAVLRKHGAIGERIECLYDVGANIGTICVPAVRRGFAATAVAIEPHPVNARLLRANVALNGLDMMISVVECAAGDADGGFVALEINERNWGDHRVAPRETLVAEAQGESGRSRIDVPLRSIDSVAAQTGRAPSLLWMDTQGYEGFVLAGAANILATRIPVVTELWPYSLKRIGCYDAFMAGATSYAAFMDLDDGETLPTTRLAERYANLSPTQGADIVLLR